MGNNTSGDFQHTNGGGVAGHKLSAKELKKLRKLEEKQRKEEKKRAKTLKKSNKGKAGKEVEEEESKADQEEVIQREEVIVEEPVKQETDMAAAPNGHALHHTGELGDNAFTHRRAHHGMNGSLRNGSVRNGDIHSSTRFSHSLHEQKAFVEKQDDGQYLSELLAEERKRCNQHKDNYNVLKQEHRNLQNEMLNLQEEIKELNEDKTDLVEKQALEIGSYQSKLTALKNKIAELQIQVPAKDRIEALKSQMISEVEGPFRNRLDDLESENESLRADNAKLKHDFAFLKTEYEHTVQRHKSTLEDLKLQYDAEVSNLRKDKDELIRKLHEDNSGDVDRMRNLQKDNAALNHRVKSLLTELDELRGQREKMGLESDHVYRLQSKQMTEFQANVRALEIEKDTLRKQCDSQARELTVLVDSQTELTRRLHEEEQKSASLRNELEKSKHHTSLQMTQCRLDATKAHGVIERERDSLLNQVDDLKARVEAQQTVVHQLENSLREKERDCAERIDAIREEEFQKLSQANHDRQKLESRVQILERQRVEYDERSHKDQLRYEQQMREHQHQRDQLEKEIAQLRIKLNNQGQLQNDLDYERQKLTDQRNQLMKLEAENSSLKNTETELTELIGHLRVKLAANNEELRRSKSYENTQHASADKVLAQHKAVWADEKVELNKRIEQLDLKVKESREALNQGTAEHTKKKEVYAKLVEKLRRKLEISEAEKKELTIQVESVKGYIPPEVYNQCKRELRDLKNRHREYKHIMLSGDIAHVPIGNKSFASANVHNTNFDISPDHTQELPDLRSLVTRLDKLDQTQKKHMTDNGVKTPSSISIDEEDCSI